MPKFRAGAAVVLPDKRRGVVERVYFTSDPSYGVRVGDDRLWYAGDELEAV
jgi:hypothetical protein